jgi:large repetitive protein
VFSAITPSGDFSVDANTTTCSIAQGTQKPAARAESVGAIAPRATSAAVPAQGTCKIGVVFTPTATGTRTGALTLSDNAANSPQAVTLTGTGVASAPQVSLSATTLTFASESIGTSSAAQTVTVTNTGNADLSFSGIGVSGDFSLDANTTTCSAAEVTQKLTARAKSGSAIAPRATGGAVPPQGTCNVGVVFTPTAAGTRTGALTLTDNAGNSPQAVTLTGTGVTAAPQVSLSPTSLTFAAQSIGNASAPQTVTVTNTGNANLIFSGIAAGGVFTVASTGTTCATGGEGIAAQASCTIAVVFTPTVAGAATGALTLTDNAGNSPQSVPLSGSGANFLLTFGGDGAGTVTVSPGNTAVAPVILSGPAGLTGTVQLFCTSNTPTITCNLSPTSVSLTGTGPINTIIEVNTYCSDAPPSGWPFGGRRDGGQRMLELVLLLGAGAFLVFAFSHGNRKRLAGAAVIAVLLVTTAVGCKSVPKGPSGATPPGTYTITITATLGGVSQSLNMTLIVN